MLVNGYIELAMGENMSGGAVREPSPVVHAQDGAHAPGDLAIVEAFVNTRDVEQGSDVFTDPPRLSRWLRGHGLPSSSERITSEADRRRVVAVREALRQLLLAHHDGVPAPSEATALLAREALACPVAVDFAVGKHAHLRPTGIGTSRTLATLFAIVFHAMHDGTWERLKACRNETCQWAFYDSSRNRSGKWCSMAVCGNRNKVASYRERHR